MARVVINLKIEEADSPQQAAGLAREIWAMLKSRLSKTPHTIGGKVFIPCPDCGEPMEIQDRELVCPTCTAAWEREWDLDEAIKRAAQGTEQILEAL